MIQSMIGEHSFLIALARKLWTMNDNSSLRVAAVQLCPELGKVDANLQRSRELVRQAFSAGARWVLLPELFTTGIIYVHYYGVLVPNNNFTALLETTGKTDYGDAQFFTQPHFETGDERYRWLNRVVAVAQGRAECR